MTAAAARLDRGTYVLFSDHARVVYVGRLLAPTNDGARIWTHAAAVTEQQHAPVVAPPLPVDPQDTEERFAALIAHGSDAVTELLTFLAPVAESVRDQSVTTGRFSAPNHNDETASDLRFRPRWVAPPSGLERFAASSGRVVPGAPPSPVERESRATIRRSSGLMRLGPQASVTIPVTTTPAALALPAGVGSVGR